MEFLWGAGKRWEFGGGLQKEGMVRWTGRRRMYPQPSCSVSNMVLVPLRKKREIEQINTDHEIPPISFTSLHPRPHGLRFRGMRMGSEYTHTLTHTHKHTWSHFWGVVCICVCSHKKNVLLGGMLSGRCVRDTSLLCTVHPLSFKHSDYCVRVHPPTSPLPALFISSSVEGDVFFLVAWRVYVSYRLQEAYGKLYGPPQ